MASVWQFALLGFLLILAALAYFSIKNAKGSTKVGDILPTSGRKVFFAATPRTIAYAVTYDYDPLRKKYQLDLKYFGMKPNYRTGYVFDPWDFTPTLGNFDLAQEGEPIICWKSPDGSKTAAPEVVREYQEQLQVMMEDNNILRRNIAQMIQYLESQKLESERKKEAFEGARMLSSMRDILNPQSVKYIRDKPGGGPNIKGLFE